MGIFNVGKGKNQYGQTYNFRSGTYSRPLVVVMLASFCLEEVCGGRPVPVGVVVFVVFGGRVSRPGEDVVVMGLGRGALVLVRVAVLG